MKKLFSFIANKKARPRGLLQGGRPDTKRYSSHPFNQEILMEEKQFVEMMQVLKAQTAILDAGFRTCSGLLASLTEHLSKTSPNILMGTPAYREGVNQYDQALERALNSLCPIEKKDTPADQ